MEWHSLARSLDWSIPVNFFSILSFWQFVASNKQTKWRPLLPRIVVWWKVSTSGASDRQACEDSHWNKRTTFVFHKIVIYNPWTLKTIRRFVKDITYLTTSKACSISDICSSSAVDTWCGSKMSIISHRLTGLSVHVFFSGDFNIQMSHSLTH